MVPARDFAVSTRFYIDLGFRPRALDARLIEMHLGAFSFILQDYYVKEWADNFVMHGLVTDLEGLWKHIDALDLPARYGVRAQGRAFGEPGVVRGLTDPSAGAAVHGTPVAAWMRRSVFASSFGSDRCRARASRRSPSAARHARRSRP